VLVSFGQKIENLTFAGEMCMALLQEKGTLKGWTMERTFVTHQVVLKG
jgi:hypothetical protein